MTDLSVLVRQLQARLSAAVEPGDLKVSARTTAPAGWLLCDGSSLLRTDYPNLFGAIGTTYGAADGTHFSLPDLRGRVPVGVGTATGGGVTGATAHTLGQVAGEEKHTLTTAEIPAHTHDVTGPWGDQAQAVNAAGTTWGSASGASTNRGGAAQTTGGGGLHQNMQPYLGLNFFVKT